jgi:hypothetical protein
MELHHYVVVMRVRPRLAVSKEEGAFDVIVDIGAVNDLSARKGSMELAWYNGHLVNEIKCVSVAKEDEE